MTDVWRKLCLAVDKLDSVGKEVEEIRGVLFELRRENDSLKTELAKCKVEATEQRRMAEEAKYEAALARERAEDLEQYGRRNNVRVFGVPETDKETAEQCEQKVLKIIQDKLQLSGIQSHHIDALHRAKCAT
nr:hypothetical protein BaRGS_031910 [Batillaria attramentaria]